MKRMGWLLLFDDIPYGTYAVSVHHDANRNDKLDHNWMYLPTESLQCPKIQ